MDIILLHSKHKQLSLLGCLFVTVALSTLLGNRKFRFSKTIQGNDVSLTHAMRPQSTLTGSSLYCHQKSLNWEEMYFKFVYVLKYSILK